jgi:hypothetical protein
MLYQNMRLLHQVNNRLIFLCLLIYYLGASTLYLCGGDYPNGMYLRKIESERMKNDQFRTAEFRSLEI